MEFINDNRFATAFCCSTCFCPRLDRRDCPNSLAKLLTTVTKAGVPADSATLLKWMESAQSKAVSAYRSASPTEQASFVKTLNTLHFNRTVIMKWTTGGLGGHPH